MNNFGVVELASAKHTVAPGWAYVPDTGPKATNFQPTNRKRARNQPGGGPSIGDLSARQEARIRKEVEGLEKDGNRDNGIPVPAHAGSKMGKTGAVRKILQSQKTFANHLDDFVASQAAEAHAAAIAANSKRAAVNRSTTADEDNLMPESAAESLLEPLRDQPAPHPADNDPLLQARVPEPPSDAEIKKLLEHPPLTYLEARGTYNEDRPKRTFCEVCGYWGRVRCMKCGTRVCALECLETHREECVTRYGL